MITDEEIEESVDNWTWRDIKPYIGYTIVVPHAPFHQTGSEWANVRRRWTQLWLRKLERAVGALEFKLRVMPQPERTDHLGFPSRTVILWTDWGLQLEDSQIFEVRGAIEEAGYHVSSISIEYDPPMA